MKKLGNRGAAEAEATASCGCVIFLIIINLLFGGWATRYIVETLSPFLFHHTVIIPWFWAIVIGLIGGEIIIPTAIVVAIIMMFV